MNSLVQRVLAEQSFQAQKMAKFRSAGKTLDLTKKNPLQEPKSPATRFKRSKACQASKQRLGFAINLVRFIVESENFRGAKMAAVLEDSLKPLLRFVADPDSIDFDDDLVFCIEALVKKSSSVSPCMMEVFPHLVSIQRKNNGCLANLLQCVNAFMVHGP